MNPADITPASLADRALFEPIAAWLGRFAAAGVPGHAELDALLAEIAPDARSGSGARIRFVPPAWLAPLMQRRMGLETMDTAAACRTYNFLLGEGRRVAVALLLQSP